MNAMPCDLTAFSAVFCKLWLVYMSFLQDNIFDT